MFKQFLKFVLPSIASMVIFNLYTLVDGIFVAHFVNDVALASINVASPYVTTIFSVGVLFAIGTSTVISIYRGQENEEAMHKVFTMNIITISIIAFIIALMSHIFSHTITMFLTDNQEVFHYTNTYIKILSCFAFFYIVSYCFEVLLKADGFPQKSIIGVCIGAFGNIVLDYVFMKFFHMGLTGAAIATGISQLMTFLYFLSHFIGNKKSHFHFIKGPYPWHEYKRIIPLGMADCISEISPGIMITVFNIRINQLLSTNGLITFSVIMYVYNLALMMMVGTSQGTQPLVSFYYGKEDRASVKKIHIYARGMITTLSLLLFGIVQLAAPFIVSAFIDPSQSQYTYTIHALKLFSLVFLIMGHVVITSGYLSAIEQPRKAFILSLSRGILVVFISLFICSTLFHDTGI